MSMPGGGRQELQELSEEIQALEEEREELRANIEALQTEQREIDEAIEGLETLETGSTVQVPVGGGAYVRAEVQDIDEVIVEIGSGYAAEEDRDQAVETLGRKQDHLDERIEEIEDEIEDVNERSTELEQQAQQAQQQMLQQMQQQQQGGPDE